jgi:hypothetical protein
MALTKKEKEAAAEQYDSIMARARLALKTGMFKEAVKLALSTFDHIDAMMRHKESTENIKFHSINAIDLVLKYAPLMLDFRTLDKVDELLRTRKRIDREAEADLAADLAAARERMWQAHRLWDHLEQNPGARQEELRQVLGGNQEEWRTCCES